MTRGERPIGIQGTDAGTLRKNGTVHEPVVLLPEIPVLVQAGQKCLVGIADARHIVALEACRVEGTGALARQFPGDIIAQVQGVGGAVVYLPVQFPDFHQFGQRPFAGGDKTTAGQEGGPGCLGGFLQAHCLGLGGMVLPQLDVGVGTTGKFRLFGQDLPGLVCEHHGEGGAVHPDAHHVHGVDGGFCQSAPDDPDQTFVVVLSACQRPFGAQLFPGGQRIGHDGVGIGVGAG
jgi:hypothetical protein